MRLLACALAFTLIALPAAAQTRPSAQNPGAYFQNMSPADAARLNQAAQNDPHARQALDQVEKKLSEAGHPSGKMLEKTRP
jgi:hypothetical protein